MQDTTMLAQQLRFMGLDRQTAETVRSMRALISETMPGALDSFYERVREEPQTRRMFSDEALIQSAKRRQMSHWDVLSQADFDDQYVTAVRKVGETHARIGLEPRWYINGYAVLLEQLLAAVIRKGSPKGGFRRGDGGERLAAEVGALVKVALLDMNLAISVYIDAAEEARRKAEETALAQMQSLVVDQLGEALAKLADGDLRHRLTGEIPPAFLKLKEDLNGAVQQLERTLRTIHGATSGLSAGADEITRASDDLSRRTEQQAATLEETAAALDEITATVSKTAHGAREAQTVVSTAKEQAERSAGVVREAIAAMSQIEHSSQQIGQIIGVIDEIAFQTNLLALNAGVEAARAGDAGKGFAVVASEVRALAQRSAEAAKEIKALISTSTGQVSTGVDLVTRTGEALDAIAVKVAEMNGLIGEIAASAQEQSVALAQVNTAVNQMDQVTQQNAAMVEQSTAASHSLRQESSDLLQLVSAFKIDLGGGQAVSQAPARRPTAPPRLVGVGGGRAAAASAAQVRDDWEEF